MTKDSLTKLIISIAQDEFTTETDKFEGIGSLLNCLAPKDFEKFSKWGHPSKQTTSDECSQPMIDI